MKKFAKHLWELCYPMLIYTVISVIVSFGATMVLTVMLFVANPEATDTELMNMSMKYAMHMTFVAAALTTPLLVLFKRRDEKKAEMAGTLKKYEKVDSYKYLLIIPFAIFAMYAANVFVSILSLYMPKFMTESYTGTEEAIYGSSLLIQVLAGGIMGPIVEEYIFRGLIYNRAKRFAKPVMAGIISAALFGIYHGNWIQMPYAFFLGLALAFVYEKYKNIFAPILLHIVANMFSILVTALTKNISVEEVKMTNLQQTVSYLPILFVAAILALALGQLIDKIVEAKEIDNEIIDSSNTML